MEGDLRGRDEQDRLDGDDWIHLVKVGAMKPEWDDMIGVLLRDDPEYAHVVLTREQYLHHARCGEIERDAETGYPIYVGRERLRG